MQEDLRNAGAQATERPMDSNQTLEEVVTLIGQVVGPMGEHSVWDYHSPRGVIEARLGIAIRTIIQNHVTRNSMILPQDRVHVGSDVELDFGNLELYGHRLRVGHNIGNPPLGPDGWLRNYRGILDQVIRL